MEQANWTAGDISHKNNLPLETSKRVCPMDGGGGSMAGRASCVFCSFQYHTMLDLDNWMT